MDVDQEQSLVFTGSGEGELKAWRIDHEALAEGLKETESGEVSDHVDGCVKEIIINLGVLPRSPK